MMTTYERSDIFHIMKMDRMLLIDLDTGQIELAGWVKGKD
jgi:hypothetical protein